MSSWYHQYPKAINALDLIGMPLELLPEFPPEKTSFGGMKMVVLQQKGDTAKRYRVMMTEQDISKAVDLYTSSGSFTFKKEGEYGAVTACTHVTEGKAK